ncbi:MAG: glutamate synthase subunit beta, partial [Betaproteobacteria bacterium]|nr:glutamate synthase subunit beta [Betaproteobacteria bacterium]
MGKVTGFLELERLQEASEPVGDRLKHYREFVLHLDDEQASAQGARCMDCGIPFCQSGCPINNIIPDWNDLVYRGQWQEAIETLQAACTLNINNDAVGIKSIEHAIIDKAWEEGWVKPKLPSQRTGKRVAVVGAGPAGMACAQQLARAGHQVTVFEKNDRLGGLLRYGIPDFKLEKIHIDRRVAQMQQEGVEFRTGVFIGEDVDLGVVNNWSHERLSPAQLQREFDAVVLTGGAEQARDLPVPGRHLAGVHFAMEFLPQQNKVVAGDPLAAQLLATGKHVVVIGGGDTGSDCVGTSNRQGAAAVVQFE